ncbi:MAG: ATP-binding protein, partial [Bacteroidales bacterium]|nr:ATP-binding protein [Bacteroidales bacterium]
NGKIVEKQMFYNPGEREQVERLSHLLMPDETKRVLQRLKERDMRCGFCCLLYGGPGTGKTETVNQLARLSGRDIFTVEISSMRSKWYGETEQIVRNLFKQYHQCVEKSAVAPILFFNEADAVFGRRIDNVMRSVDKTENAIQNIILQEMEVFEGVMIATTNLATSLDPAFERRFLFKMELSQPNAEVKARLWKSMLPSLSDDDALQLAKTYNFSGGQIENISRKCTVDEVLLGKTPDLEQIKTYCNEERIVSHKGNSIGFARA